MAATNFVTKSNASKEALKTATLLKTLNINALIMGEVGVGKKTLAQYIFPNVAIVDASNFDELLTAFESNNKLIITNLHNAPNLKTVLNTIEDKSIRVIATSSNYIEQSNLDETFSVKFDIPPLSQREEDVNELIKIFSQEAIHLFGIEHDFDLSNCSPDLSKNSHSLKRQVMINYLLHDIKDTELMEIFENFLFDKLGSNSDYRNHLHLYEVPLIRAGLKKYKSQLKLSDVLGLNRNTLRKKIADNQEFLD